MSKDMIGVILAAGKGSRMYPFSERLPKSLLPIFNRPLLAHQLEQMAGIGIRRVIIVIGYYGFEIANAIGDGSRWGLEIKYVDQEKTLGIAHALGCLESRIDSPFLLFLGDIFFHAPGLAGLIEPVAAGRASGVLAAKREADPEAIKRNFAIIPGPDGAVARVIEKPRYVKTDLKGCGLYAFDLHIFDAVRRTPRTAARDEYEITDSIQLLIQDGFRVEVLDVIEDDINLTYPEDLLEANLRELARRGGRGLIGANFSGPPPERIERSFIGDNVSLPAEVQVRDSIIFSNVTLKEPRVLNRVIVTPDRIVALDPGPLRD
jgi:dTDP-glucose pyrophosphorylase